MTTHLPSVWRDSRICAVELELLSPTTVHADYKHRSHILPSIVEMGLQYPLCCVKLTPEEWYKRIHRPLNKISLSRLTPPKVINGVIWAIKMGCNRYQAARELGYVSIDCIFFDTVDDAVKMARWHQQCDPLNHPSLIYRGLYDY